MSRQTHVLSFPESGSAAAKKTKYAWVAVATLVAALILGAFASIPRVSASSVGTSNLLPYTDVTWFYSEHTGAQTDAAATLADNPELVYAQAYVPVTGSESAAASLADNPELVYALAYGPVTGSESTAASLADNPELVYALAYVPVTGSESAGASLADNPELVYALAYVPVTGSESAGASLADNPELVYAESYVGTSSSTVSVSQASGPVADTCRAPETRLYDNPELAYSEHFGGC